MTDASTAARALVSRSWEGTTPDERQARTAPGLAAINAKYRALVDPTGVLPEAVVGERIRQLRAERLAHNLKSIR